MRGTLALLALLVPVVASAQQLGRVVLERSSINVGEPARITVESGDGRVTTCGLLVIFGDGEARDYRVGADPMPWSHAYEVPGRYGIRVEPKTVLKPPIGLALPCTGDPQTVKVTVLDPNDPQGKARDLEQQRRQLADRERDLRAREADVGQREKALALQPPPPATPVKPAPSPPPPKKPKGDKPVVF